MDFKNKVILGPMVRVSTLPLRTLCLKLGADLVFGQELIDYKVMSLQKTPPKTPQGRIMFFHEDKEVFSTYPGEPIIFQIGTSDAVRCLKAAQTVFNDVAGIDINMGCPMKFSVHKGMGAALLSTPEIAKDIIQTLKRNLNIHVSCKIRIFPELQRSLDLVRNIEAAGADAVTIRPHFREDRRTQTARIELVKPLTTSLKIPTVYNGDILSYHQIEEAKSLTGCDGVMISRGAMWNPSIFSPSGFLPLHSVLKMYMSTAKECQAPIKNTRYVVLNMLNGRYSKAPIFSKVHTAKDYADFERVSETMGEVENYSWLECHREAKFTYFAAKNL